MARGTNQKMKLIYLMKILLEKTDDEHGLRLSQIIDELALYDITAERKSLYDDMELLRVYGLDVNTVQKDRSVYYYIGKREFEIAELKLLVDAVQSSKFITEKKSRQLIRKLESLTSIYDAKKLHRQVYVYGRIKTMNESIYYNVDKIHSAMDRNVQIRFQYFHWNVDKEMELRHGGDFYQISPWELAWNNENYYLIAYDNQAGTIKHFRVDKMLKIGLAEETRGGREIFEKFDLAAYSKKMFGMFDAKEQEVTILCENRFANVMIDRFGKEVSFRREDAEHFRMTVRVAVSIYFIGWIIGLGPGVKIIAPEDVVEKMRMEIARLSDTYQ